MGIEEYAAHQDLKEAHRRALRDLDRARRAKNDYSETVYRAVRDATAGLDIPPVPAPRKDKRTISEEIAAPLFSDLQLGKVTPEYNSEICEQRIERYAQEILAKTDAQRKHHPVRKLVLGALGDIIEGVIIFPGQHWLVDAGLYRQLTVDGPRIVVNFLRTLLTEFDEITVYWVIGNHGRLGKRGDYDPESNGDRILGRFVQMLLANEPRIKFIIPDGMGERNWYTIAEIGNYRALCIHGDQIQGQLGFPWYGLGKKVNGWASGAIPEKFGDVWMGHWHQAAKIPMNFRAVWANGTTESYNTFAQENMAAMGPASQWLLFVDPEAGKTTASYEVSL